MVWWYVRTEALYKEIKKYKSVEGGMDRLMLNKMEKMAITRPDSFKENFGNIARE